jgi:hypothetical protein
MLQARLARLQKTDVSGVHPENQADAWNEIEFEIEVLEAALAHLAAAQQREDGFKACAEHGPWHIEDGVCPGCAQPPASQGAGTVCPECEACDWEADTSNYRGLGSDGPAHTCKPAATDEKE